MLGGMRVEEIADELAVLVAGLEPGCYAGPDAARLACCFERIERLSAGAKTLLARRAAECGEWSKAGARTPAGWLAGLWGVPHGAAHAALSLAEAASVNPSLDQALRRGELSAAQAHEVAAAAGADPSSAEKMIVEAKTVGFKALREQRLAVQNTARSAEDDARRAERQRRSRYVRHRAPPPVPSCPTRGALGTRPEADRRGRRCVAIFWAATTVKSRQPSSQWSTTMTLMNADERERFLATLRGDEDFRAAVRRELLTEELLNLPQSVSGLVDAVAQQREDFIALTQSVSGLVDAVAQQREDFIALTQSVSGLVDAVAQQRQEFIALTQSVGNYMERTLSGVQDILTKMDAGDRKS